MRFSASASFSRKAWTDSQAAFSVCSSHSLLVGMSRPSARLTLLGTRTEARLFQIERDIPSVILAVSRVARREKSASGRPEGHAACLVRGGGHHGNASAWSVLPGAALSREGGV